MKFSWLLATIREDFDNYIYPAIESIIVSHCPYDYEILVISPYDIPRSYERVRYVKEISALGSVRAFNEVALHAQGEYLGIFPCDWMAGPNWWNVTDFMESHQAHLAGFRTGNYAGHLFPTAPCMHRSLYEGPMRGHVFNPAYCHNYCDIELGLKFGCLQAPGVNVNSCDGPKQNDNWSIVQKNKYYRLDGMVFNRLWGHLVPHVPLFPDSNYSDVGLEKMMEEKLQESLWVNS